MYSKICKVLLIVAMVFSSHGRYSLIAASQEIPSEGAHAVQNGEAEEEKTEAFQPGDFMFDHIKDGHEWHIITIGHKHISIPLPVILYSKQSGFHMFMSGKFKHGHATYKGF